MPVSGGPPTLQPFRVGCSGLTIYPWVASLSYTQLATSGANGPIPFQGIDSLGVDFRSSSAKIKGGETVRTIAIYETDMEVNCRAIIRGHDYRMFSALMGNQVTIDLADGLGPEVQYSRRLTPAQRSGYFTLVANSVNGDPQENFVAVKCKYMGLTRNLQRDKETENEFNFELVPDPTWTNMDGSVGGDYEYIFANNATPALHS